MIKSRYRRILWFFGRMILSFIYWDIILPRIGLITLSRKSRNNRFRKIARDFRLEAIKLGGVMIKVGQFLSARLDVLPKVITDELSGLQDEVAPESFANVRIVVENEFGGKLEDRFDEFDPQPIASASIGQVHLATIHEIGETGSAKSIQVAVKIQRLNIRNLVQTDLAALKVVAQWIMRYRTIRKRANIPALLEEFSASLYEELDYLHEGRNAERFAVNFKDRLDEIAVPGVFWNYTTQRVLTLEYLQAIKITDYHAIDLAGISRAEVATRLLDTYLQQIFEDRFFHADPHPGNLFVKPDPDHPDKWKLVFVDFGMAGEVPNHIMLQLRDILIALAVKDSARIVKAYQELGVLLPGADIDLLEKATAKVFERFWGKTAPEMMKMHHTEAVAFVEEFGDLIYEMPFQVPENMILLVRCLGILSGMCSGLDKDFNIWTSVMPYAEKLVESEAVDKIEIVLKEIERYVTMLLGIPTKTDSLLKRLDQGRLEVRNPDLVEGIEKLNLVLRKIAAGVIFAVLVWASVTLFINTFEIPAYAIGTAAVITLLWMLVGK